MMREMNKKNQFSQTEGVRLVDAATQTEEEVVEVMIKQVDNKEIAQTEEEVATLKRLVNDEQSTKKTEAAEVMELKEKLNQVDNKSFSQTEARVVELEKTLRPVDDKEKLEKSKEGEGEDRPARYRYALLVKKGMDNRESSLEFKEGEDKEGQDIEAEDKEEGKEEIKESGTIYSYAITEGKNMKKGDTNKHATLFH